MLWDLSGGLLEVFFFVRDVVYFLLGVGLGVSSLLCVVIGRVIYFI